MALTVVGLLLGAHTGRGLGANGAMSYISLGGLFSTLEFAQLASSWSGTHLVQQAGHGRKIRSYLLPFGRGDWCSLGSSCGRTTSARRDRYRAGDGHVVAGGH